MKKLKFMKGISYHRRRFNRDEEILSLNQEIIELKKRMEIVEIKSFESESQDQPSPRVDQLSKSLELIRNIGNLKISESDSTYEKEEPFEVEKEMEMEG